MKINWFSPYLWNIAEFNWVQLVRHSRAIPGTATGDHTQTVSYSLYFVLINLSSRCSMLRSPYVALFAASNFSLCTVIQGKTRSVPQGQKNVGLIDIINFSLLTVIVYTVQFQSHVFHEAHCNHISVLQISQHVQKSSGRKVFWGNTWKAVDETNSCFSSQKQCTLFQEIGLC